MMAKPIPDGLVVLTFDDGVKSQFTFAAPLLQSLGFGATFYITEGLRFLVDKERYLTWEEVRALSDAGFEIGNHTRNHVDVGKQSKADLHAELDFIDMRCAEYGIPKPETFCYPGYQTGGVSLEVLREHGFRFARRGVDPEYPYFDDGGRGPAYDPALHDRLMIPTTAAAGPRWTNDDFEWAIDLAVDGCIAVLTFHGVPDLDHPWVHFDPSAFERCMRRLHERQCKVIALRDLKEYVDISQEE